MHHWKTADRRRLATRILKEDKSGKKTKAIESVNVNKRFYTNKKECGSHIILPNIPPLVSSVTSSRRGAGEWREMPRPNNRTERLEISLLVRFLSLCLSLSSLF